MRPAPPRSSGSSPSWASGPPSSDFSFTPEPTAGWLSFAWELDGQFLLERSGAEHPDAPSGLCVISVAEEGDGHEYVQHYFDSRGVVRVYRMTLRDGVWQLVRDRPDFTPLAFHQRYTGRFGDDGADDRRAVGGVERRRRDVGDGLRAHVPQGLLAVAAGRSPRPCATGAGTASGRRYAPRGRRGPARQSRPARSS